MCCCCCCCCCCRCCCCRCRSPSTGWAVVMSPESSCKELGCALAGSVYYTHAPKI
eukprot:jgi/Botrbrau1/22503/Bobra.114_2s0029.1